MPDGTEGSGSPFVMTGVLTEPDNRKSGHYVAAECAVPVASAADYLLFFAITTPAAETMATNETISAVSEVVGFFSSAPVPGMIS